MDRSAKPFVLGFTDVVSLQVRPECCKVHHVTWSRNMKGYDRSPLGNTVFLFVVHRLRRTR